MNDAGAARSAGPRPPLVVDPLQLGRPVAGLRARVEWFRANVAPSADSDVFGESELIAVREVIVPRVDLPRQHSGSLRGI